MQGVGVYTSFSSKSGCVEVGGHYINIMFGPTPDGAPLSKNQIDELELNLGLNRVKRIPSRLNRVKHKKQVPSPARMNGRFVVSVTFSNFLVLFCCIDS